MLDATKSDEQRQLLEIELDAVGIRLNKQKPDVVFKKKITGGVCNEFTVQKAFLRHWNEQITFNTTVKLTKTDERTIRSILASCVYIALIFDTTPYSCLVRSVDKLHNCDVMIREDVRVLLSIGVYIVTITTDHDGRVHRRSYRLAILLCLLSGYFLTMIRHAKIYPMPLCGIRIH